MLTFFSNKRVSTSTIFLSFCFLLLISTELSAQGDIFLTPRRVIFEGGKTTENINLANSGKDTAQYTISVIHYKMKNDGSFVEITKEEAGNLSAESYIRFYPRTIILAPGEAQVVRVQYNKPSGIQNGEYRSHLYFRATPKPKPLGLETKSNSSTIGVNLIPVFGLSIPVIIREGIAPAIVSISDLKIVSNADSLNNTLYLNLNRTGNASCYGDITLIHQDLKGNQHEVGIVKGIAIYYPNSVRNVIIPLISDKEIQQHQGKLIVQFKTRTGTEGKDGAVTETVLDL
jgi:P pilus assembly chaperone PapD